MGSPTKGGKLGNGSPVRQNSQENVDFTKLTVNRLQPP